MSAVVALTLGCFGCGGEVHGIDAGTGVDSGLAPDARVYDDAGDDAGRGGSDAGGGDAGLVDAGPGDAGPPPDAGPPDAGPPDAGPPDAGPPDAGGPPPNIVFATSATYTGALGGLAGADAICNAHAAEAGLSGTYVAWLSTDTVDAIDRLAGASGWVRPDGRLFANAPSDIVAGRIYHPVGVDETGARIRSATTVWTATFSDGTRHPSYGDCEGWTATTGSVNVGDVRRSAGSWTAGVPTGCANAYRLFCFGIDNAAAPMAPPVELGRMAFVAPFNPGGGVAAADATCQAAADDAALPGTYRAAIATDGATIASRFDTTGARWVRPDGVALAPTAAGLFSLPQLDATPNLSADGSHYYGNSALWTGVGVSADIESPGTAASTCQNWTSASSALTAYGGRPNSVWTGHFAGSGAETRCDFEHGLVLCLEL